MKSYSSLYRRLIFSFILAISFFKISAQGRLVLNGGIVSVAQGAYLVIDNPSTNAITRNSGHIISEGENNRIKWNIGTTTGTYIIPWGYGSSDYIPLTFTKTAGTGSGHFLFSTYHTTCYNSAHLPAGVTNINGVGGTDNSTYETDRFWQINAVSYSTKPTLSNLIFTYLDAENASPNTILESGLRAKRYNSTLNTWTDNFLSSSLNTSTNKLTVASVDVANLQAWWTLGTLNANRYWVAPAASNSNLAANWSASSGGAGNAGVPTLGDATIFDGAGNFNCVLNSDLSVVNLIVKPEFTGTITQGSNIITVNNDATFSGGTFTGGANVNVGGNFIVSGTAFTAPSSSLNVQGNFSVTSGTFNHNNGTVVFSGSNGAQTINSATVTTFNNITATNTSASPGVIVQSNQNLKGVLTLGSNVNFDADGTSNTAIFKLLSTSDSPTQDAAIAPLPSGAVVSGNVTVERYMSKEGANNNRVYRYISSPIQNATVADLQQEIHVTGTFTGRSTCSGCVSTSQSLFAYNEAVITDTDKNGVANQHDGYIDFPDLSNTETFQPGRGYALYVRANLLTTALWNLRGQINAGNVSPIVFPVSFTSSGIADHDGWNLVGNPFPSTIDWNASSGWTKTNLETSIYITDNASGPGVRFATWNGTVGTNGGTQYVATGQAFWVKANGNGSPVLQANENVKASGTQTEFFRKVQALNLLRITVSKGAMRDETVIHFREDATSEFDSHADTRKMPNTELNIASILNDGNYVAINSIPSLNCNTSVPLALDNVTAGNYKLEFSELGSLPEDLNIYVTDKLLDSTFNVRSGIYSFAVTSNPNSYGSSRFKINFSAITLNPELTAIATDVCSGQDAAITINNPQPGVVYTALFNGLEIPSSQQNGQTTINIPSNNVTLGINAVVIRSSVAHCTSTVEKETYFTVRNILTPASESAMICGEGTTTLSASGAPVGGMYNWYENESSTIVITHDSTFQTPLLRKSQTYYVSIVNELGCEGARVPVKATVNYLSPAIITSADGMLTSNYSVGNQWYLNNEKIEGATDQMLRITETGTYHTVVVSNGCNTLASIDVIILPDTSQGDTTQVDDTDDIISNSEASLITVSPNPIRDTGLIEISNSLNISKVIVISSVGKVLGSISIEQTTGKKTGTIQLDGYPSGIYMIQVFTTTGVHERKILKL